MPDRMIDKILKIWIMVVLSIMLLPFDGLAQNNLDVPVKQARRVIYGGEVAFKSRSIWHGLPWSRGAVMQPSVWATALNYTFMVYSNFDLETRTGEPVINELDLYLYGSHRYRKILIEPSINFYHYPGQNEWPSTGELSVKFSYPDRKIRVFTIQTFDIGSYRGAYFGEVGISYEQELNSKLSLDTDWSFGVGSSKFNKVYLWFPHTVLNVFAWEVNLDYLPTKSLYLRPYFGINVVVDPGLRSQVEEPFLVNYGLTIGIQY
jgi:hypothetical protein